MPSPDVQRVIHVNIAAQAVHDNGNGTFTIRLIGKPLSESEQKMLIALFPTLTEKAYDLLDKEVLLSALATEAQLTAPPKREKTISKSSNDVV
jgi:hypothetical protein